jgi:outer membrane protein assembly factor BamA
MPVFRYTWVTIFRQIIFLSLFALCGGQRSFAQSPLNLKIHTYGVVHSPVQSLYKQNKTFSDSLAVFRELDRVVREMHGRGWLGTSVDSLRLEDDALHAWLSTGKPWRWLRLETGNIPEQRLRDARFRAANFGNKKLYWAGWLRLQGRLLRSFEHNGYPLASVFLSNLDMSGESLAATITSDTGPHVEFGVLRTEGDLRLAPTFLEQFLGIQPAAPFHSGKVQRIAARLQELPFAVATKPPEVLIRENGVADITLFLDAQKAGRFDFLIGVLPNSNQTGNMLITGKVFADFQNQLGKGERFTASFERLRPETQQISFSLNYPYLLQLPFQTETRMMLYRRDTVFFNMEYHIGAGIRLDNGLRWKGFWENRSTRLTGINTANLVATQRLPPQLDVSLNAFGMEAVFQRFDYLPNPRRGWNILVNASAGIKRILPNQRIEALGLGNLYDALNLRSAQYRLNLLAERFLPLGRVSTFKMAMNGAFIFSAAPLFRNEQFRIGGNRMLRGFDEEFFFVNNYVVATAEYRVLASRNSYFFTFFDVGRLQDFNNASKAPFYPYGFGAGLALDTKAGLLGLSIALGTRNGIPLDFSAPKLHLGYIGGI